MQARRRLLLGAAGALALVRPPRGSAATATGFAPLVPRRLAFPRDFGAHPGTRLEWWYLTAVLDAPAPAAGAGPAMPALGVQLTFFRSSTGLSPDNPSAFAARELVLAHAALADPRRGALLHEERLARVGFGVAQAALADTAVAVDRWRLERDAATGRYDGHVAASAFALELAAQPTQPLLLQGEGGYSRKGGNAPGPGGASPAASFYYSEPQLAVRARVTMAGHAQDLQGRGWLDHEWSSGLLPDDAAGWDWAGFNLDDGTALTVFRIRARGGSGSVHAYAALRAPGQPPVVFPPAQVGFTPLQFWTSPRTRARYPVAQRIRVGTREFETQPLMPDQEYAGGPGGAFAGGVDYWEGASLLREGGQAVGRGYLELTGYAGPALGADR